MNNTTVLILFFLAMTIIVIVPIFIFGYLPMILRTIKMKKLALKYGCAFDSNKKEKLRWSVNHWKPLERDSDGKFVLPPPIKRNIISGLFNGHKLEIFDSYQKKYTGEGPWAQVGRNTDYFERNTMINVDERTTILPGATSLTFPSVRSISEKVGSLLT